MNFKEYKVRVYENGSKHWFLKGEPHREDGPALDYANGDKYWYLNGERHREDGPAVEYAYGNKRWFLNGKELTEEEFNNRMKKNNCNGKIIEIEGVKYQLRAVE
jgi:hypothetical protein